MLLQELFETKSESHRDAAIAALHRRLTSKGDKESVISAAYEVGRAFGIPARELAKAYQEVHEAKNPLFKLTKHLDDKKKREEYGEKLRKERDEREKDKD